MWHLNCGLCDRLKAPSRARDASAGRGEDPVTFAIRASRLGGPFTLPGGASTAQLPAENAHRRPARERFAVGDLDSLIDFRAKAPGMPHAHPTIEHFSPLFVTLGSSSNPE
jgi:hypothetical protein